MAFTNPQAEYELNGLKHTPTSRSSPSSGPIYMLGLWELSVGVLLVLNQANSSLAGIITLLTLMSLYKASVAFLLWKIGDDNRVSKVAGNIVTAVALASWALYQQRYR